jgi:hypothetical protein
VGARTPGLVRAGFRRLGQGAAAGRGGGYEQLFRSDLYVCAGLLQGAGFNDNPAQSECGGTAAVTGSFDTYLIAIPEVAWETGTLSSIGFYAEGGPGFSCWAGIFADTIVSANHYPGSALHIFEHSHPGFDGGLFRSAALSLAVDQGDVFWVVTQVSVANAQRGYRVSNAFRPALGENTASPITTTGSVGYMGWRSAAPVTYDATLTAFPASGSAALLNIGSAPIANASANTTLRPSTYVQLTPS